MQTGINDFLKLDIGKPAPAEVLGAVRHLSAIRGLLLRTDLQPFPLASEDGTTIKSPVPELLKRVAKIDTRSEASVMHRRLSGRVFGAVAVTIARTSDPCPSILFVVSPRRVAELQRAYDLNMPVHRKAKSRAPISWTDRLNETRKFATLGMERNWPSGKQKTLREYAERFGVQPGRVYVQ